MIYRWPTSRWKETQSSEKGKSKTKWDGVITWLLVQWSRVYHMVITWLRGADHVTVPSVITWLSRHWYRDWACTDHVPGAGEAFHSGQRSWGRRLGIRKCGIEPQGALSEYRASVSIINHPGRNLDFRPVIFFSEFPSRWAWNFSRYYRKRSKRIEA